MEKETIKGYKGFDKDLKCRGFQYEVGKEYSTEKAVACNTGFHYCENPMDVLGFYAPCDDTGNLNRFCEVEGSGDFDKSESDKICCTHLKVKAEIGLQGLIKAGVKFILDRVKWEDDKQSNTGDRSLATNTGDRSLATNTGYCSLATNTGYRSLATNTGDCSLATNTGDRSLATILSHQHWLLFLSHQHWLPFLSHQYWRPFLSHQHWRPFLSHQHWLLFLSHQHWLLFLSHQHWRLLRSKR